MKTLIANAKDSNWTGNETNITADITGDTATWSHYDYNWELTIEPMEQMSFQKKRDEQTIMWTLEGDDWDEPLKRGYLDIRNISMHRKEEIMALAIRQAHAYICNHI